MNYFSDSDIIAGLRNMLVNPRARVPAFAAADAFSVGVDQSASRQNVQLGSLRPGWWVLQSTDAWLTLRQADSRTGPTAPLFRSWRMGPATRIAVYIEADSQLSYVVAGVASGFVVDPTNGLASTGTSAPTLSGWWTGLECPPRDTRAGVVALDDGTPALANRDTIIPANPMIVYPPGFATRVSVVATSSVVFSLWSGEGAAVVVGEVPAARSHQLAAVDPWAGVRISVAAGAADCWLGWSDQ
jgi:hypothetical protein